MALGVLSISRWTIGIHWWSVPFQVALMLGLAITCIDGLKLHCVRATGLEAMDNYSCGWRNNGYSFGMLRSP